MRLRLHRERLSICRLPGDATPPPPSDGFYSLTRSSSETSIVCVTGTEPDGSSINADWRAFEVEGPLDFSLTGILAAIATPLAGAGISIFAISTFDTDYVLVKNDDLRAAVDALHAAGHQVTAHASGTADPSSQD